MSTELVKRLLILCSFFIPPQRIFSFLEDNFTLIAPYLSSVFEKILYIFFKSIFLSVGIAQNYIFVMLSSSRALFTSKAMLKQVCQIQPPHTFVRRGLICPLPSILLVFQIIARSLLSQPQKASPLYLPSVSSQITGDVRRAELNCPFRPRLVLLQQKE